MNQLPSDLLNRIFIQLPYKQKKECMLVCRLWEDVIKNHCLFHTLEIATDKRYHEFMNIMKHSPSFRKQVVDLAVLIYWESQNVNNVIEYFPNLEHFSFTRRPTEDLEYVDSEMTRSNCRMRYLRDVGSCPLFRALSKAGLCSRLNEICIDYFEPEQVLPLLKDLPALKHLSLGRRYITITQLEMLHENLPALELLGVDLAAFDDPIPTNITPADLVTSLYVQMEYASSEDQTSWMTYVTKKYPNLQEYYLEFESRCLDIMGVDEELVSIASAAYTPLLRSIGPQLKSIYLPGAEFSNYEIFQKMDEYRCQIKNVVLFSNQDNTWCPVLSQSNQARYIENLTIYDVRPCSFDWLKSMEVLKSLSINFENDAFKGNNEIDINMLIKSCSKTVKSIKFNYGNYCINDDFSISSQIEEMQLDCGRISANIDQFIANCLPNLHVLSLNGSMQKNSTLILPKHHFSYVRLYFHKQALNSNFLLTTTKDSRRYLFKTGNKKTHVHMSHYDKFIKPIPEDSFNGEAYTELIFGSVRKLIIDNRQALLI